MSHYRLLVLTLSFVVLTLLAAWLLPQAREEAELLPPESVADAPKRVGDAEKPCSDEHPEWRAAQTIEGVSIAASPLCEPDNPYEVAAAVKGVNNISMATLMQTHLAQDALTLGEDLDHDGDPDVIHIKLEVVELNGASPDGEFVIPGYAIAPGIKPAMWVFAPKSRDMGVKNARSTEANALLRSPSPTIRVEQGDKVTITLENTHYFPHTLHLHGVDHPWRNSAGEDNDGDGDMAVFPGDGKNYEIQPRHAGTMLYHCHVQTDRHMMMGMSGLFVVEENRPNNWVQTFNIGAGQVRHPSVAVSEHFSQEYDLLYQALDKELSLLVQQSNDPRMIAKRMNREYNVTDATENYFLFNGRSYPYTLRDAMIVAEENETIKLRVGNMQKSTLALHIHGHKVTPTAQDGVALPAVLQVPRDVVDVSTAQRADLSLQTVNDGLHSYGPGAWMMHDHVEPGVTTDGIGPGGNMALLSYQPLLNDQGMPKGHDEMLSYAFTKSYYAGQASVWAHGDFAKSLGAPGMLSPAYVRIIIFGLAAGALVGLALLLSVYRRKERHE
ncbi:MAG: multicopper oxidase domain-containing protein [Gammaproteobacteria bacterium]